MPFDSIDDAAAAALWMLGRGNPLAEHIGLLYEQDGSIHPTPAQSQNRSAKAGGEFKIPRDSLRGLYHNHPPAAASRRSRATFSEDDIIQANKLNVPSYISIGDEVRRYDPGGISGKGKPVLAQFPIEDFKRHLLAKGLLK